MLNGNIRSLGFNLNLDGSALQSRRTTLDGVEPPKRTTTRALPSKPVAPTNGDSAGGTGVARARFGDGCEAGTQVQMALDGSLPPFCKPAILLPFMESPEVLRNNGFRS